MGLARSSQVWDGRKGAITKAAGLDDQPDGRDGRSRPVPGGDDVSRIMASALGAAARGRAAPLQREQVRIGLLFRHAPAQRLVLDMALAASGDLPPYLPPR